MNTQTEKLKTLMVDILHRHYYPTMHEAIADVTLINCADDILQACQDADIVFLCNKEDKCFGMARYIPIDLQEDKWRR